MADEQREHIRDINLNEWFAALRDLSVEVEGVRTAVMTLRTALVTHMTKEEVYQANQEKALEKLASLVNAFPHIDGIPDVEGHYNDHLFRMREGETVKKRKERITDAAVDVVTKAVVAGVIFIFILGVRDYFATQKVAIPPQLGITK